MRNMGPGRCALFVGRHSVFGPYIDCTLLCGSAFDCIRANDMCRYGHVCVNV